MEVVGGVFASWTSAFASERATGKSTGIPCSDSGRTIGWLPKWFAMTVSGPTSGTAFAGSITMSSASFTP